MTRDEETVVAIGDGRLGVAVLLGAGAGAGAGAGNHSPDKIETVSSELRKLLGDLHVDFLPGTARLSSGAHRVAVELPPGLNTLPAIASGLCDRARVITGRATAVVVRNAGTDTASVIAVSHNADRRLLGAVASPESAVGRACFGEGTITTGSRTELFGGLPEDRRRREEQGTAYPLRDGRQGVGALVVFGPNDELDPEVKERVMWLAVDAGPRFAAAAAVRVAEERALTDPLTRLPNRAALDQAMSNASQDVCAVLYVDLDHFKSINDRFGHAAGDDALRHIADVFRGVLRERDVAARTGGEEFVLWLPDTTRASALDVAERVRRTVGETEWTWEGSKISLTCSIGVAAKPDTTTQIDNLLPAADAALYRAKRGGRNRVEEAQSAV